MAASRSPLTLRPAYTETPSPISWNAWSSSSWVMPRSSAVAQRVSRIGFIALRKRTSISWPAGSVMSAPRPAWAPPDGTLRAPFLSVIVRARRSTSSSVTPRWARVPPPEIPRTSRPITR